MLLRSSSALAVRASLVVATLLAIAPAASAQTAGGAPATKKTDTKDTKKADDKGVVAPATGAAAATPATPATEEGAKPADEAAHRPADKEDKHAIYISLDLGFSRPDVGGISDNTGFDKTAGNGLLGGLGLGYRQQDFRFGGRFRTVSAPEFSLWSIMGEIGYGLPFRPISPVLFAHMGYMFDSGVDRSVIASSLPRGNVLTPDVDLKGIVVGGELVASYWVTKFLRVGPFLGADVLLLGRGQAPLPQAIVPLGPETKGNPLFVDSGSGQGYMLNLGIRGTGDIGF